MRQVLYRIRLKIRLQVVTLYTVIILLVTSLALRSRNIKPGFFTNDRLVELDPLVRLLFIGMWQAADRRGLLEDRPLKLKIQILPADVCDIDEFLFQLQNTGFIVRYYEKEYPEKRYITILNFPTHQNPHKDEKENDVPEFDQEKHSISTRPARCQHDTDTVPAPDQHQINPADSLLLITDSLSPDSLTLVDPPEGSTKEGGRKVFEESTKEYSLAVLLRTHILSNRATARVPDEEPACLASWCLDIDRMIRLDKRDPNEIEKVIRWCQADPFWMSNVLSPAKLRKQFDQLAMKMEAAENGGQKQGKPSRTHKGSRGKGHLTTTMTLGQESNVTLLRWRGYLPSLEARPWLMFSREMTSRISAMSLMASSGLSTGWRRPSLMGRA